MNRNLLISSDIYKWGHMSQVKPGTTKMWSYLMARSGKKIPFTLFYGLQYYLKEYLSRPITQADAEEFYVYYKEILGFDTPPDVVAKVQALVALGYMPLEIKAVPEGEIMPCRNILMSSTNTVDGFHWCVGFTESLLLKIWNTITVAGHSKSYKNVAVKWADLTCDNRGHVPFAVHDFGYRSVSSEETAELSGSAHLVNFYGSDTPAAIKLLKTYYGAVAPIGLSVPAGEHSCACSWGKDNEFAFFEHMLTIYPEGIFSAISDTWNLWTVLTDFAPRLKDRILARKGKVVFRPDSGNPELIICGDPAAPIGSPENRGVIRLLDEVFGSTVNEKGYKVLHPAVGAIFGEAIYLERYERMLARLAEIGYASSNIVVGVGGLLLQQHNRDDQGFAFKATYSECDGVENQLFKDPITDPGKKSHCGLITLTRELNGADLVYTTSDRATWAQEASSYLQTVWKDGKLVREHTLEEIRQRAGW